MYICGDFNIDLLKYEVNHDTTNFVDTIHSCGLYPIVNKPTRITGQSATLIDNIYTNDFSNDYESLVLTDGITDHLPVIMFNRNRSQDIKKTAYMTKRKLSEKNITLLQNELELESWHTLYESNDTNGCYDYFIKRIISIVDKCCPYVKRSEKSMPKKPWFSNGLINACRKKNLLYKKYLISRTVKSNERYKLYKNKLTCIIRKAEKQYYKDKFEKCKNDTRNTWAAINDVLRKSKKRQNIVNIL